MSHLKSSRLYKDYESYATIPFQCNTFFTVSMCLVEFKLIGSSVGTSDKKKANMDHSSECLSVRLVRRGREVGAVSAL